MRMLNGERMTPLLGRLIASNRRQRRGLIADCDMSTLVADADALSANLALPDLIRSAHLKRVDRCGLRMINNEINRRIDGLPRLVVREATCEYTLPAQRTRT
jgi:hypothetical protein